MMNFFIKSTLIYIVALFTFPSIILTISLMNDYDFTQLSVISSERFWIYLVEIKRAQLHGLTSWPGNIILNDPNWLYLERLLVRLVYFPFNVKIYFIVDAIISAFCFIYGLKLIIGRYYPNTKTINQAVILLVVAVQPIYLIKAMVLDPEVIDIWFGRGLVASSSFIIFLIGTHELVVKKRIFVSLICSVILGLIHFYTFTLYLGTISLYILISIIVRIYNREGFYKIKKIVIFYTIALIITIFFILNNMMIFKSDLEILYFLDRYIPKRSNQVFFIKDLVYLSMYAAMIFVISRFNYRSIETNNLISILLYTITSALIIDFLLLVVSPQGINIHFRIYIIEPLFVMLGVLYLVYHFPKVVAWVFTGTLLLSLGLLVNQVQLLEKSYKVNEFSGVSVHHFIFHNSLDECKCTIFDPYNNIFLDSKLGGLVPEGSQARQWKNAILHLSRY